MEHFKSDIFGTIEEERADIWAWLGDAAYIDDMTTAALAPLVIPDNYVSKEYSTERFNMTLEDPFYKNMISQEGLNVIGVWDDHDYGANNGDRDLKWKYQVRDIFLNFIGEPQDTIRRFEKHRGIY
jgi:alkaline phosphatase D